MKLIISPLAAYRLREIQAHIAPDGNLNAALRVVLRIRQTAEILTVSHTSQKPQLFS